MKSRGGHRDKEKNKKVENEVEKENQKRNNSVSGAKNETHKGRDQNEQS